MQKVKKALNDSKNAMCREVGHDYQSTTSDTYRVCSRSHCGAAQRLANGQWIDATQRTTTGKKQGQQQAVQPTGMWG
jgi:hypothetical protein